MHVFECARTDQSVWIKSAAVAIASIGLFRDCGAVEAGVGFVVQAPGLVFHFNMRR